MKTSQKILRLLCWTILLSGAFGAGYFSAFKPTPPSHENSVHHEKGGFLHNEKGGFLEQLEKEKWCDSACCNPDAPPSGRWHKVDFESSDLSQADQIRALQTIGYAAGTEIAPENTKVVAHNPSLAQQGLNFYISGHAPMAFLMDMQGKELHRWVYEVERIWPTSKGEVGQSYWRRAHLFENGDLLAIYDGVGLIKINKNSELIWSYGRGAHHDLFVTPEGLIYVLTRKAHIVPRYHTKEAILEDFIAVLDANGTEIRQVSLLKALENSSYAPLLQEMTEPGDIFHTNTIELVDSRLVQRIPYLKEGQVLVSMLRLNSIAVVDLELKKVVWALSGLWHRQHQPTVIDQGRLLIFDNIGLRKESRILEFDPATQEIFWEYRGTPEHPFYSYNCGSVARLPNGNTLITESNKGRAFEVTPKKEIVWEYLNPYRAGPDQNLIAAIFEIIRLPLDFPQDWVKN